MAARIYPTYREEYGYDDRDRPVTIRQVLSAQLSYTSYMAYDAVGNLISQIDAKERSSQKHYDELHRLKTDIDADN